MIKTRKELKEYIDADRSKYSLNWFDRFIYRERWKIFNYLQNLRKVEYHANNKGWYHKIMWCYHYFIWSRLNWRYGLKISPNTCGKGLFITHIIGGGIRIAARTQVGENCIIGPFCILGTKSSFYNVPQVGDNVEICMGAKIYGKVHIGDNSIICPNSVVINDVPPNSIVSGVPAKLIKTFQPNE